MKYFILALLFLFPVVLADNITVLTQEQTPVGRTHALVEFDTGVKTLVFVQEGVMRVDPPRSATRMLAKLDSLDTLGMDWYLETSLPAPATLTVLPVGSIFGFVYDEKGKALPGAVVSASCGARYGATDDRVTNNFGAFEFDALPVGNCVISSNRGDYVGSSKVNITRGSLDDSVSIILDHSVLSTGIAWTAIILFVLLMGGIVWFWYRKSEPAKPSRTTHTRLDTLLPTLSKKEEEIVSYLLEHGESYQNRLVHELHIPKTTIVRLFESLEKKKVLSIEKIGKTKKLTLSKWILASEYEKD